MILHSLKGPESLHMWNNSVKWRWIVLMMEAASTYETLVNFYQTTRRYNPEDSHLHTHPTRLLNTRNA
jgi:hypothetical protein